ncbi:MAG: cation:proton antiporter [Candidatus Bathyarchaeota archaeon]|nr:MAG: cation:proton antiporter [Candidatus Bathyarchaeota archaeon]
MASSLVQFDAIYNILIVVILITLITRKLNFPQTLGLIIAGIYSTLFTQFQLPHLETDIFISILLPPILFQETQNLDVNELIEDTDLILSYAVLGTITMVASISIFSRIILGFSVIESLLLGIIIAPTDPIAVISTFHNTKVIKRFQLLVAGESLFNDGVAIVVYSILITIATLGSLTVLEMSIISFISIVGGILIGLLTGYFIHFIFCWTEDKFVEVLVSFVAVFGGFHFAEQLGASGVLAIVIAGLIINYRSKKFGGIGRQSIDMLDATWEFIGFITQSIAFIFIGMNTDTTVLTSYVGPIFAIMAFTLLARYIMVEIVASIVMRTRNKYIPNNWTLGLTWSGLRGGVSIVLALGASSIGFPHSEELLALTFGVVLVSNVLQGLTMVKAVNLLKLSDRQDDSTLSGMV